RNKGYGPPGLTHIPTRWENRGSSFDTMSKLGSDELAQVQRQLQPKPARRGGEKRAQELSQLVQAVEDGMPMEVERSGGILDRSRGEVGLERLEQLLAAPRLPIQKRPQGVRHEALREHGALGEDELGDHLVVSVRTRLGAQLPAGFDGLLCLQERA